MAKTGFSAPQVQLLGGLEQLAGASGLIGGLSTLQTNLQAITDGTDATSGALKALGLTAAQLKGQLPTTQLEIIAKSVSKFGDGATKTTALTKLLGSAAEGLIRTLDEGASGVKALESATVSAGAVLDAGLVEALARTHQHILELNQAWTSGAGVIVGVANPAIDRVIVKLTQVLDSITADKIRAGLVAIGEAVIAIIGKISEFAVQAKELIGQVLTSLDQLSNYKFEGLNQAADNAQAEIERSGDAMLASWTRAMHQMGLISEQTLKEELIAQAIKAQEVLQGMGVTSADTFAHIGDAAGLTTAAIGKIKDAVTATTKAFRDLMAAHAPLLLGEYAGKGQDKPGHALPQVPAIPDAGKDDKADRTAQQDAKADAEYDIEQWRANAQEKTDLLNKELAEHQLTTAQWLAQSKDALADEAQDVQATYDEEIAKLKALGAAHREIVDVQRQEAAALKDIAHQVAEDEDKAAKETAASWKAGADEIADAFNSQVGGLLKGTENFATAARNIMASFVEDAIKGLIKWGVEHLATMAMNTAATVSGQAAQTGAMAAGAAAQKTINATTVSGDAGRAAAGAYAAVAGIPIIGPVLAPAAAAVAFGAVEAFGSFDVGGYVNSSGLAMIHAGEEIRPADVTTPYRGGGGSVTHNHTWNITGGPNADPREIAREVARRWDLQPSLRPKY